jgi:hypothetical protein
VWAVGGGERRAPVTLPIVDEAAMKSADRKEQLEEQLDEEQLDEAVDGAAGVCAGVQKLPPLVLTLRLLPRTRGKPTGLQTGLTGARFACLRPQPKNKQSPKQPAAAAGVSLASPLVVGGIGVGATWIRKVCC